MLYITWDHIQNHRAAFSVNTRWWKWCSLAYILWCFFEFISLEFIRPLFLFSFLRPLLCYSASIFHYLFISTLWSGSPLSFCSSNHQSIQHLPPSPPLSSCNFSPMPILFVMSPPPFSVPPHPPTSAGLRLSPLTSLCHMPSPLFTVPQRP